MDCQKHDLVDGLHITTVYEIHCEWLKSAYSAHTICNLKIDFITALRRGYYCPILMRADFACQLRPAFDRPVAVTIEFHTKLNTSKSITRLAFKIIHFRGLTGLYHLNCRRAVFICLAVWFQTLSVLRAMSRLPVYQPLFK